MRRYVEKEEKEKITVNCTEARAVGTTGLKDSPYPPSCIIVKAIYDIDYGGMVDEGPLQIYLYIPRYIPEAQYIRYANIEILRERHELRRTYGEKKNKDI